MSDRKPDRARDDHALPFPSTDDDAVLRARVRASYASLPAASAAQVAECTRAALVDAQRVGGARVRGARFGGVARQRWWWGAAAAAVLVVSVARPWRVGDNQRHADSAFTATPSAPAAPAAPVGTTSTDRDATRFKLTLPSTASEVAIVGDFNGWDEHATPMVRDGSGWSVRVPLPPGRHVYAFVIDGTRWLVDPLAPQVPDAAFGPANALVVDGPR